MNDDNNDRIFGFPFQPYQIQMEFMHVLYESIKNGKIAIMESPTGTGKSLSTICAALSWLEDDERRQQNEVEMGIKQLKLSIQESETDQDWLNAQKRKLEDEQKLEKLREEQLKAQKIIERLENARRRNKSKNVDQRKIFAKRKHSNENEQENDDGNIVKDAKNEEDNDLLPSDNEECDNSVEYRVKNYKDEITEEKEEEAIISCRKLIYASRTHSQLEQFVKELEKTRFRPRILTLGSRKILCINEGVKRLGQTSLINDRCNELLTGNGNKECIGKRQKTENGEKVGKKKKKCGGCEFAKSNAIEDLSDTMLIANEDSKEVQGISEFIELGHQNNACPYFATKSTLSLSQLILMPYNILLHQNTRKAWNFDLKNNVILIDEAHNLLQTLASIHSVEINANQLDNCLQCIHDYLNKFRMRLNPKNLRNIRQIQSLTLSFKQLLIKNSNSVSTKIFTLPEFTIQFGDSLSIDLFRLLAYIENSKLCQKLRNFNLRNNNLKAINEKENENKSLSSSTPLYQLRDFIQALTTQAEDARIVIECPPSSIGNVNDSKLRFILLNPAEKLREIVSECHSLILLGGTMRPVDQLLDGFKRVCGIQEERVLQFSCGHVIRPEQLMAISIGKGPDQTQLNFQYNNRESNTILRSLAQTIINLIRHIPNGVVIFFPSYTFLATFLQSIRSSGHFAQFEKLKTLFVESRTGQENDVWPLYCESSLTPKGAILMAVVNGKLSEGINFSDELGRCVLMVGMPYPNKNSSELQERMKFVDEKISPGAGSRFYEQLCLQSLNQAIGRVIRHKNDYAAILLLDERFTRPNFENGLPEWIRQRFFHTNSFSQALSKLINFYRFHRESNH